MRSFRVVEDEVVKEFFSEAGQIIDEVEVIVDEFFLNGSVKSFNAAIDLWAARIGKVVGYSLVVQVRIKIPQELRAVIGLQGHLMGKG